MTWIASGQPGQCAPEVKRSCLQCISFPRSFPFCAGIPAGVRMWRRRLFGRVSAIPIVHRTLFGSAIGVTSALCIVGSGPSSCEPPTDAHRIAAAVHSELLKLRPGEEAMRKKWEDDEAGWHKLPPRAWPPRQPKPDELKELQQAVSADPTSVSARFDLATCLTFNLLDANKGLAEYRDLAKSGNIDAMVAVGVVLLEGIGQDINDANAEEGLHWLRTAANHNHAQALYEIGCLHYLGSFPELVPPDEPKACEYFEGAARQQHTSALFMLAEFLIEGTVCAQDEPRAIRLLCQAAERGHRMARHYIRRYLEVDAKQLQAPQPHSSRELANGYAKSLPLLPERSEHFSCFHGDTGERASLRELLAAAEDAEVVVIGECHDDPVAHALEMFVLVSLAARRDRCGLSLEMFETDAQLVLDEYLAGLIRERDFLLDARPWANYETDYRPLIEFAKACQLPVIAANAPRRYVGAVGRMEDAFYPSHARWPAGTIGLLPPLPLPTPSERYLTHLRQDPAVVRADQLGLETELGATKESHSDGAGGDGVNSAEDGGRRCPYIGLRSRDGLLQPMLLWDASMACAIVRSLSADPQRLVVHVCGSFHCERRVGIAEMLQEYRPGTKTLVIVAYPSDDCHQFVSKVHRGLGDFVVLTDASLTRSHDYTAPTESDVEARAQPQVCTGG